MKSFVCLFFTLVSFYSFSQDCPEGYIRKTPPQGSTGVKDLCLPEIKFSVVEKPKDGCKFEMIETGPGNSLCRPRIYNYEMALQPEHDKCPEGYFRKLPPKGSIGVRDMCLPEIQFGIFEKSNEGCKYNMIETGPKNAYCRPQILDYSLAIAPKKSIQNCTYNEGISIDCSEGTYKFIGNNSIERVNESGRALLGKPLPEGNIHNFLGPAKDGSIGIGIAK